MAAKYRLLLSYVIPLIVSISTCVIVTHQARQIALLEQDNVDVFYSFAEGLEQYKPIRQEWKTRILSNFLAGRLVNHVERVYHPSDRDDAMRYIPSLWSFAWLFLTNLVFVALDREKALVYIFGVFAGLSFAYTPGIGETRIYPWDLTSLFCFSCFVGLIKLHRVQWLVVFIPIATLFKETALILLVAFLFWDQVPLRRRLVAILATLLATFCLKGSVDLITANPSPIVTMTLRDGPGVYRFSDNIRQLLYGRVWTNHPFFINSGLLASLLILPMGDRRIHMLKAIGILFILGNFFFGNIIEYRIWFEVIPLSLYAIDVYFGSVLLHSLSAKTEDSLIRLPRVGYERRWRHVRALAQDVVRRVRQEMTSSR